ncbi:MAG: hypothetical protein IT376_21535 [Polyangiaceae bacterium]|nr:hypothetical protein [Polyangiaceae bacterium]
MSGSSRPSVRPSGPPTDELDTSWDDEPVPELGSFLPPELEADELDRVTQIPSVPPEELARRMFAKARSSPPPAAAPLSPGLPASGLELDEVGTQTRGRMRAVTPRGRLSPTGIELDDLSLQPTLDSAATLDFPDELGFDHASPRREAPATAPPSFVTRKPDPPEGDPAIRDMKDRYAMGDYSGALVVAEGILETRPEDADAIRYAGSCREVLMQMYSARLGDSKQIVRVAIPPDQVRWLSLDHRAGFLLSLVDGLSTIEELLDMSGMPQLDALRLLYMLLEQRVIALEPR